MQLKRLRKTIVTLLTVVLLLTTGSPVFAAGNQVTTGSPVFAAGNQVTIWVDEEQITYTEQAPFIVDGTTLASAEPLFEKLDVVLIIDEVNEVIVGIHDDGAFAMQIGGLTAVVNDKEVELLAAPQIVEETLFVPVRFVSEAAGYDVEWGGSTRQVLITSTTGSSQPDAAGEDGVEGGAEDESEGDLEDGVEEGAEDDAAVEGGSRGFLWKTEHEGNTVYLLGSIHVANEAMYPLREEIENAFVSSDYLVVEVDITKINQAEIDSLVISLGAYHDGSTLPDHISPELYEKLGELLPQFGFEPDSFDIFKPWAITTTLQTLKFASEGFQSTVGIDVTLLLTALEMEKPIMQLETLVGQLRLYADLSPEVQELMLEETIDEFDAIGEVVHDYAEMWITGDEDMLLSVTVLPDDASEEAKDWNKKLLDERNINMVEQIEHYLQGEDSTTYFVVVGAAHMLGDMGIIKLLEEKGFTVTRE